MNVSSKRLPRSIKRLVLPWIALLVLGAFSSFVLFEATKVSVTINENGEKQTVKTHARTVGELVELLDISVSKHDKLSHEKDSSLRNGMTINYYEAIEVLVSIDDVNHTYATRAETVEQFLEEKNLSFTKHDDVSFSAQDPLEDGDELIVTTAYPVTIKDGDNRIKVWTTGDTVESLLETHNITIDELDKVDAELSDSLGEDSVVQITRVEKDTDTTEERVTFQTETRPDNSLAKGQQKVIEEGQEGVIEKTYEITIEDGEEVSRELVEETVKIEKKNRIVAIGTKEPQIVTLASTSSNNESSTVQSRPAEGETIVMSATAYTADCNGCSGITATGINLKANRHKKVIAVDPAVIPLGSTVWVEGYGTAIAGDTGGSIKGNRIDIHVPTKTEAHAFGRRNVKVKVIK